MESKLNVIGHDLLGGYGLFGIAAALLLFLCKPALYTRLTTYLLVLLAAASLAGEALR